MAFMLKCALVIQGPYFIRNTSTTTWKNDISIFIKFMNLALFCDLGQIERNKHILRIF